MYVYNLLGQKTNGMKTHVEITCYHSGDRVLGAYTNPDGKNCFAVEKNFFLLRLTSPVSQ